MKSKSKNFLFICYDYPPILSAESIQIARKIKMLSTIDKVFVLTTHLNPMFEITDNELIDIYKSGNIKIHRTPASKNEKILNIFFKILNIGDRKYWWKYKALHAAKQIIEKNNIDIIHTDSNPIVNHFVGLYIKNIYKHIKWVAHFSDPWTLNPYISYKSKLNYKINRYFEEKILKNADTITVTSNGTKELFVNNFNFLEEKIKVIPHYYDYTLYPSLTSSNEKKEKNKIKIIHTGNIYGLRTIKYLLCAVNDLKEEIENKMEFLFFGRIKTEEIKLIHKLNLQKIIKYFPPVTYKNSLKLMLYADFLLLIEAPLEKSPFFPSKLVDYIGARKPILILTPKNSETMKIIEMCGLQKSSIISSCNSVQEIKQALIRILNKDKFIVDVNKSSKLKCKYNMYDEKNIKRLYTVLTGAHST